MKLSKRIISALLVLVMVVSVLPSITISTTVKAVSPEKGMTFSADCLYEIAQTVVENSVQNVDNSRKNPRKVTELRRNLWKNGFFTGFV
jgi:hypothetical protein